MLWYILDLLYVLFISLNLITLLVTYIILVSGYFPLRLKMKIIIGPWDGRIISLMYSNCLIGMKNTFNCLALLCNIIVAVTYNFCVANTKKKIKNKKKIGLISFDLSDVQSVRRFVRCLITKWYDHYSSHHLIYNVKWIASLECTVFHRSIDLVRAWRRALCIHRKEGKVYPPCKMAYVVILWALQIYCFIYISGMQNPVT